MALCQLLVPALLPAAPVESFNVVNYNPLPQLFGLPYGYNLNVLQQGASEFRLMYDKTSFYASEMGDSERILFDGESTHITFIYKQGVGDNLQLGIAIPWFSVEGGSLDDFLIDWHDTFNLPQSGRDIAPRNQLKIFYQRDGVTYFDITEESEGVGDVRLVASWSISSFGNRPVDNSLNTMQPDALPTLNVSLKLPTGDSDTLHGSGATDLAFWFAEKRLTALYDFKGAWYQSLGFLVSGKSDVMPGQQKNLVVFGGAGLALDVSESVQLKIQLDMHSKFYSDTEFEELSGYAAQFTMGGTLKISPNTFINIGVSEDLNIDASPDVNFHVGLKGSFE